MTVELREHHGAKLCSMEIRYRIGPLNQGQAGALTKATKWLTDNNLLLVSINLQPDPDSPNHLVLYVIGDEI